MLAARPLILPPRHFVYPRDAEEVERGALEVLFVLALLPRNIRWTRSPRPARSSRGVRNPFSRRARLDFAIRRFPVASGLLQNQKRFAPWQAAMRT